MSTGQQGDGTLERLERLEAIEEIRLLKIRYAQLCDGGYDADALADLFTEDALWDAGDRGRCEGREEIRAFWAEIPKSVSFGVHFITNHTVDVHDRTTASGVAYLWQPLLMEGTPSWSAAVYRERYVRAGRSWKFAQMLLSIAFITPSAEPWAVEGTFLEV